MTLVSYYAIIIIHVNRRDIIMEWIKYTINTDIWHEDEVAVILSMLGINSIEIQDNTVDVEAIEKEGGFYEELQPDYSLDDNTAKVIFYLEDSSDPLQQQSNEETLIHLRQALLKRNIISDADEAIESSVSNENDWRDNWKKYFHAFTLGDIMIRPSWEDAPLDMKAKETIIIDPGISFGTGSHESTRTCILAMQKYLKAGDRVLDVGFGSGILSIAALKLGAGSVSGTDIDEDCLSAAKDNFSKNGLKFDDAFFCIGDLSSDKEIQQKIGCDCYDVVLANLLADIIISMNDRLLEALKPDGILIASGIIDFKENEVISSLESVGFEILEVNHDGEWVQVTAKRNRTQV